MTTTITVHGYHLDGYGHVNNARYLEFLEAARWDQLQAHQDLDWWHDQDYAFVIVNININFRRPASLGDQLVVGVELAGIGDKSARVHQTIQRDTGAMVADADVTFAVLDRASGDSVPLTGEVYRRLAGLGEALGGTGDDPADGRKRD